MNTLKLSAERMRQFPIPDARQIRNFVLNLSRRRSWYKHLDLAGSKFLIYLDDFGNNSRADHRRELENVGHLRFAWSPEAPMPFLTPEGDSVTGDPALLERATFLVYPYISEEIYWSLFPEVGDPESMKRHPDRKAILQAVQSEQVLESFLGAIPGCYLVALSRHSGHSRLRSRTRHLEATARKNFEDLRENARNRAMHQIESFLQWLHSS